MHDAFVVALERWPKDGVPANPRAWLISTGRFKAIDALRRRVRFDASHDKIAEQLETQPNAATGLDDESVEDDQLRLIFTCCHPALAPEARVALTLREVCGLTTEEIARAFLAGAPTLAQRIVRAKAKIRDARIPYQVPSPAELPERLDTVLQVIYLVFNEGYSASSGATLTRADLSGEAIRLGRLLNALLPGAGGSSMSSLPDAVAGITSRGQDLAGGRVDPARGPGPFAVEPGANCGRSGVGGTGLIVPPVRTLHTPGSHRSFGALRKAGSAATATDWPQIVALYVRVLARAEPSAVVELNRAVAVAMRDGPEAGLKLIDAILARGEVSATRRADYHYLAHSARADLCRRLGKTAEARSSYEKALALTQQEPERRFLENRLQELDEKK